MKMFRRVVAIALAAAMLVSSASVINAAGSPEKAPKNPGFDTKERIDTNTQDHHDNIIKSKLNKTCSKVVVLTAGVEKGKTSSSKAAILKIQSARNKNNKKVAITHVGDGKKGVFDRKSGRYITDVTIKSAAKSVTISKLAFKGSKVEKLTIKSAKVTFKKDAFKGTKVKDLKITIKGSKKKASAFTFQKGCFNGLSSKAKIVVMKSAMSGTEFKLLKAKLKKAGFKGTIKRY